ncbi:MAG: lipid-A-disaccharide synthase [Bdellovibrionales bacterium]
MTSTNDSVEILIVAAEASSTLYAQRLLEHWRAKGVPVKAFGIGSRQMETLGFEIIGRSEELAVVGLQEVIAHWSVIKGAFHGLLAQAEKRRPKVALLLDYPDFNLRLAKKLKKMGIKVVYYISPQVWAWRQSRVHLIKRVVDQMLVLFPFEVDFYKRFGVPVQFVGHPLLDELAPELFSAEAKRLERGRYGITDNDTVLALMPGSRKSELKHHLQVQIEAAGKLRQTLPGLKTLLLVAPTFSVDEIKALLPPTDVPLMLIKDEPFKMINLADVVLCASGTATLMVGLMDKPMVVMYRMNAVTAWIAKRFVRSTAHFGLINLVLNERVVPELFQEQADSNGLASALRPLLQDSSLRQQMANRLHQAKQRLGERGATQRVADAVEALC